MSFSSFDELFVHINAYAQSVPYLTLEANMRLAAREFCERTRCWRHVETIALAGADVQIESFHEYAQIFEIESAFFDDIPLERAAFNDIDPRVWNADASSGAVPQYISQTSPSSARVVPPGTGSLRLSLFLEPTQTAQIIPNEIAEKFGHHIADGAAWRVLLIPDQPYTNPQLGVFFKQRFDEACDRYSDFAWRGQQRAPRRTKPSWC